ncbi:hypothetical protein CONPUDRAFT_146316 [Coniophora puteana RWD-64-598 SS2]|uniref:Uncharacterized protein n=1 Tax=Coniophora puteana (strain RWD-64-598) TaxID=741705 RepID=A0A5M3MDJ7_CONPW|nr:uncharacterized protein CONPUDRAFT_146316 [Coniophora puteana RWD-64-598 SS2]EIW77329.1 hypothetical protein CONPUDRAFT_146316 [Coniophora puteana RWD-64-598 SS2]
MSWTYSTSRESRDDFRESADATQAAPSIAHIDERTPLLDTGSGLFQGICSAPERAKAVEASASPLQPERELWPFAPERDAKAKEQEEGQRTNATPRHSAVPKLGNKVSCMALGRGPESGTATQGVIEADIHPFIYAGSAAPGSLNISPSVVIVEKRSAEPCAELICAWWTHSAKDAVLWLEIATHTVDYIRSDHTPANVWGLSSSYSSIERLPRSQTSSA